MEPFGERLRARALLAVFGARAKAAERFAPARMPRQIAEEVVAAVQQVVPDGYTVRVTGADGRGLLVDGPLGTSASPAFALPVLPGLRRRSVAACAESVLALVADFVTDHEGGSDWLDPDHRVDGPVETHASVHDGHLHLAFRAEPTVVRELDPVPLPDGWR